MRPFPVMTRGYRARFCKNAADCYYGLVLMKKSESTFGLRLVRILLTGLVLATFLLSIETRLIRSTSNSKEKTGAIYVADADQRDLALSNSQNIRADRNLSKPKPERHHSQPASLTVRFITPDVGLNLLTSASNSAPCSSSSHYSQPPGRAPPYVS